MNSHKHRILIADDHVMVRESIAQLLNREEDFLVVAQAASMEEALHAAEDTEPDAAVIDLSLGQDSGLDLIVKMNSQLPELKIVALSMHDEMLFGEKVLKAGGKGYVSKSAPPVTLVTALRKIFDGGLAISERLQSRLIERLGSGGKSKQGISDIGGLTQRELEVLRCIAQGLDKNKISAQLGISANTVETHRTKLKLKLGVGSHRELFLRSLEAFPEFVPPSLINRSQ